MPFMFFMVNFSLVLAWKRSGLGSEAALEAKRPWKRSGLGSEAALEAKRPWKRSGLGSEAALSRLWVKNFSAAQVLESTIKSAA
jgi:hypothetical protein